MEKIIDEIKKIEKEVLTLKCKHARAEAYPDWNRLQRYLADARTLSRVLGAGLKKEAEESAECGTQTRTRN